MSNVIPWVVLELTSKAEGEDPDMIHASIRHHIRDAEVFVPASVVQRGDNRVYQYLVDGYAFVRHKHPENHYARLEDTKYVQGVLYTPTGIKKEKKLATITSDQVEKLRAQIKIEVDQGIEVGDTVVITSGPYKNISAIVKEEISEHDSVLVHIKLRSTARLVTLPRAFLRLEQKSPNVIYRDQFLAISRWAKSAHVLLSWSPKGFDRILNGFRKFIRWERWYIKSRLGFSQIRAYYSQLDFSALLAKTEEYGLLYRCSVLRDRLFLTYSPLPDLSIVASRQLEFSYLSNVIERVSNVYFDLKKTMEQQKQTAPVNLIVDGTQLFIRCSEAPGLGALTDSKGRSTGGVVGFLRSLGSYKKRFPTASIYVCWDGSSQRRKAMYTEYKANRISRSGAPSFGWDWLKETLPLLGVEQAINPEEEADDVMASLVHGALRDQPNIMITTDRDLLQLVSEFTNQLCPAVGAGKEKLYDLALIQEEYGVSPPTLVHIRALSGDSSDNIAGVPNFGLKTAAKVVKMYGTVNSLLASNFVGLGKAQVANLRASEKQILLNVELLTLRDVPFHQIRSNPNQIEVEARLKDLEIKSDPILAAFFPKV